MKWEGIYTNDMSISHNDWRLLHTHIFFHGDTNITCQTQWIYQSTTVFLR